MFKHYDLVIIGGGPGGYETAIYAKEKGLNVCLIEKSELGGTCLNCGCIPTKTYYSCVKNLEGLNKMSTYGVNFNYTLDYQKLYEKKNQIISDLKKGIENKLSKLNVDIIKGTGKIINENIVKVNDELLEADYIIIATGSSPLTNIIENDNYAISSEDLLDLKQLPKSLTIIGGGVIGIEMASIFNKLGTKVEIVEMADTILPSLDSDISKRMQSFLSKQGIKIYTKAKVNKFINKNSIEINIKDEIVMLDAEYILMAIGRKANTDAVLSLYEGFKPIDYTRRGFTVNSDFQTSISNIYAIGDCNGKNMLAHYATYSGYHVINKILNITSNINSIPACIFTFPEISTCGKTERECKDNNINYEVRKVMYGQSGKALAMNETEGFVKAIISDGRLIGATMIGECATEIIHEASIIIDKAISQNEVRQMVFAHPTLSEIFKSLF